MKIYFTLFSLFLTSIMFSQTSAYSTSNTSYDVGGFESIDYIGSTQRELQRRYTKNQNRFNESFNDICENLKYSSYDDEVIRYTFGVLEELIENDKIEVDFTSDYNTTSVIRSLRNFVREISREEQKKVNERK
ncbi:MULTISPECIES: hypothetical protein [unclassified Myroides]|uniref:hypothetical protein n=1 Tax=unclassified Myroides TaxID=2642485 RepID=UPI0031016835